MTDWLLRYHWIDSLILAGLLNISCYSIYLLKPNKCISSISMMLKTDNTSPHSLLNTHIKLHIKQK